MDTGPQQPASDDVTDTSRAVTSRAASDVDAESPSMSFEERLTGRLSPSPPKIPRLRIVMTVADHGQSRTSPGSGAYVVTVDDAQRRDVTDDVAESSSPSAESGSRQRRKARHGASTKVRSSTPRQHHPHPGQACSQRRTWMKSPVKGWKMSRPCSFSAPDSTPYSRTFYPCSPIRKIPPMRLRAPRIAHLLWRPTISVP